MTYKPGDFWRIDDRTGFKVRASQTRKQWDQLIVHNREYEVRQPQDFVRGLRDNQNVPDPRLRPEDIAVYPAGGPFFLVQSDEYDRRCIDVQDGEFYCYRGRDAVTAEEL